MDRSESASAVGIALENAGREFDNQCQSGAVLFSERLVAMSYNIVVDGKLKLQGKALDVKKKKKKKKWNESFERAPLQRKEKGESEQGSNAEVNNMGLKKEEVEKDKVGSSAKSFKPAKNSSASEIDEIFGTKKRKVVAAQTGDNLVGANATEEVKETKKKVKSADVVTREQGRSDRSASGSSRNSRKKTLDGYTIYAEDEIGWNKKNAGGTALCPFDCDCCF
ncbi:hypothetical protein R1flu_014520 [Riccia fluitans]|uniref:DUF1764 domain-containing protein n=1 Tax=Riccia fluitans TaxID=41844 RepID=A0ABD1YHF8_9MARC